MVTLYKKKINFHFFIFFSQLTDKLTFVIWKNNEKEVINMAKKITKLISLLLAATLLFCGCQNNNASDSNESSNNTDGSNTSTPIDTDFSQTDEDMFSNRDTETDYSENESIVIHLNGNDASCDSKAVIIEGSTITITDEGTYVLNGTLNDGMIIVNAEDSDKPQLVFDNATINSSTSAPIYILEADKVFITLADGSTNTLSNGGTFTAIDDNNIDATIFSKQDLTFNGTGSLTVTSPAGHGIVCKDDLVFTGGTYTVTSSSHGIDANDSLRVADANITITAGKDGIHVENSDDASLGFVYITSGTFDITAEGDGISAGYYMQIESGSIDVLTGGGYENGSQSSSDSWGDFGGGMGMPGGGGQGGMGGERPGRRSTDDTNSLNQTDISATSATTGTNTTDDGSTSMKGLKANSSILINGGTFTIDSADDAVHSNLSVYITGGTFTIASGDDGVHAEEDLTITGGNVNITQSYEGLEALNIVVSGGDIDIQSTDDGLNAAGGTDSSGTGGRDQMFGGGGMGGGMSSGNGSIVINGGNIFMYAKGDGLDANGTLEITGGYVVVTGPTQGDTAILDYDKTATITGGTFIGVGSTMMAQTFSDGTQGTMAVQASASGGTEIKITDTSGKELISYTPETAFACIIISTPDIEKGESYTIYVGSQSGTFAAN